MASCQVQVAPARGKLRPACPGGMHAVVNCVPGPRFHPAKAKPGRRESRAEVGRARCQQERVGGTRRRGSLGQAGAEGPITPMPYIEEALMQTGRRRAKRSLVETWNLFKKNCL